MVEFFEIFCSKGRTKVNRMRPIHWMSKWLRANLVALLVLAVAMSVVACPLWMASMGGGMRCSDCPESHCPYSVCQASSPYLTSQVATDIPVAVLPAEAMDLVVHQPLQPLDLAVANIDSSWSQSAAFPADALSPDLDPLSLRDVLESP